MKRFHCFVFLSILCLTSIVPYTGNAENSLLSPEETLWLKARNNTIIVYPEKNFPPYSYQNTAGTPQGLSIDYIELIAEKIGAKVEYLQARPLSQVIEDIQQGKGDVLTSITDTEDREKFLYFTDNYITVPAVIVVRKDSELDIKNLNDLVGRKVAIGSKYAVEEFVRKNNPRIVIESMTDDEVSLQQLVLGEVDAAIMDIASLSYYLSKQVLNSVKVVGGTGFEYKMAFAVSKEKLILQSILDKGLQQISTKDREIFNDKWIKVPNELNKKSTSITSKIDDILSSTTFYIIFTIGLAVIVIISVRRHRYPFEFTKRNHNINDLKEEMKELEYTSETLVQELESVKHLEEDIKNKIKEIDK